MSWPDKSRLDGKYKECGCAKKHKLLFEWIFFFLNIGVF